MRNMNLVMKQTINWFQSNLLSLNYNKTHLLQFWTKKQKEMNIQLMATNSLITYLLTYLLHGAGSFLSS